MKLAKLSAALGLLAAFGAGMLASSLLSNLEDDPKTAAGQVARSLVLYRRGEDGVSIR